jgi:hypothetical protein
MMQIRALLSLGTALVTLAAVPTAAAGVAQSQTPAVLEVELAADLSGASFRQVEIVRLLIRAARIIDDLYAEQLAADGFYPADMGRSEFEAWTHPAAASPYTRIRRNAFGALEAVPYHEAWREPLGRAARLLAQAGEIANDEGLRTYLTLSARALITGDYRRAEAAWLAMRDSDLDVLIGPVGTDDDQEFGLKAAFGAHVMLRDWEWGARLAGFTVYLPEIQQSLPVAESFRAEVPDVDIKLAVYDLLYQAGYGATAAGSAAAEEAGRKRFRVKERPRQLQLRNIMRARFDAQVLPVANAMISTEQRANVGFDAFFLNAMLKEMARNLGMRETVSGRGPVRAALGEHADTLEEAKAAVLSLWVADWLHASGELPETALIDHAASFLAGLFRTLHLDADTPAGQARMLVFNYFRDWGAFRRDTPAGRYRVDMTSLRPAVEALAAELLTIQGAGDYGGAAMLIDSLAQPRAELRDDLARLDGAAIPAALVFHQGEHLLGL